MTAKAGRVVLDGTDIAHATPHDRVRLVVQDEPTDGIHSSSIKPIGWVVLHLADDGLKSQRLAVTRVEQVDDFAAERDDQYLVMLRGDLPPNRGGVGRP